MLGRSTGKGEGCGMLEGWRKVEGVRSEGMTDGERCWQGVKGGEKDVTDWRNGERWKVLEGVRG